MIELWTLGELRVTMVDYLKGVIDDLLEVITGRRKSPVDNNIFQVSPKDKWTILNEERQKALQHMVAQMIFVTSMARKDINMAIAYICT